MAQKKHVSTRVKLPEDNVEYTFVFPGRKYISYIFICQRADGRVVLMNTKTKQFTNMTPGWFSKLRRWQLVSAKPYDGPEKIDTIGTKTEEVKQEPKEETFEEKIIRELRELTPAEAFAVQTKIGRTAESLASELERLDDSYTQEYVNRVCRDMMVATECYNSLRKKERNSLFSMAF